MDIDEDDHCTPFPPMPPQFMSVATPSSSLGDYEGDPGAMTTTQHLDEEKQPRLPDKSQETMEGGKPSKKPRHRHSLAQLAALNELFEKNEHPSLDERVELAEKLGMCVSSFGYCHILPCLVLFYIYLLTLLILL